MTDINKNLDYLKKRIQESDFLEGRGLSNEVNIQFFCYDAKEEMAVRHFVKKLKTETLACNVICYDLYEQFLEICESKNILDRIPQLEEKKGTDSLISQLDRICNAKMFAQKMQYQPHQRGDVILLTGVGKVFPFARVHHLLDAMQPLFTDVPIVVLYPGKFDGHQVKLFNKLKANEYYRAFNIIKGE